MVGRRFVRISKEAHARVGGDREGATVMWTTLASVLTLKGLGCKGIVAGPRFSYPRGASRCLREGGQEDGRWKSRRTSRCSNKVSC